MHHWWCFKHPVEEWVGAQVQPALCLLWQEATVNQRKGHTHFFVCFFSFFKQKLCLLTKPSCNAHKAAAHARKGCVIRSPEPPSHAILPGHSHPNIPFSPTLALSGFLSPVTKEFLTKTADQTPRSLQLKCYICFRLKPPIGHRLWTLALNLWVLTPP